MEWLPVSQIPFSTADEYVWITDGETVVPGAYSFDKSGGPFFEDLTWRDAYCTPLFKPTHFMMRPKPPETGC